MLSLTLALTTMLTAPLAPTQTFALLGGRLTILFAKDARAAARGPPSIMAAAPSQEAETRLFLPMEGGDVTLLAEETYQLAPGSDAPLLAALADPKLDTHPAAEAVGKIRLYCAHPAAFGDVEPGGPLVDAALAVLPDGSVVRLSVVAPPTVKNVAELRALAAASFRTLAFRSALKTDGRTITFDGLSVAVPDGWGHREQEGEDFSVHVFQQVAPWGTTGARVGVYVGDHPSYQHAQQGNVKAYQQAGHWLGQRVTWHEWGPPGERLNEAMLARGRNTMFHVWYRGEAARALVESMKETAR